MFSALKPHDSYRHSGTPWLPEVPSRWSTPRLKAVLAEKNIRGFPDEPLLAATQSHGVILKSDYGSRTVTAQKDLELLKLVEVDDFVISLRSFQGGIERARARGIISPAYTILEARQAADADYLALLFKSRPFIDALALAVTGIREGQNIEYPRLARDLIPLPSRDEQGAIVKYLAHAHRRIDRAIAAKRKLIALLEEQKQAIINQAVTRGLDPTVPLEDTGIPWLGKAPEHWQAVRFKHRVGFQEGPGIMAAEFRDVGIPLLRISCMAGPEVDLHGCNFLGPEAVEERWAKFRVNAGDYLLSASGSTGTVKPVGEVAIGAVPYTGLIRLWPRDGDVDMEFIRLSMTSAPFASQIDQAKSGVGIEHFGPTHLKRMWIAMPPIKEQMAIVANVASATAAIDASAGVARRGVEILREFRTRLTSDVVTGQVDVRHIAATLPDLDPDELTADVSAMDDGLVDTAAELMQDVDV